MVSRANRRFRIGTARWSIPRAAAQHFAGEGTHLQRYARVLRCAEINSSFHRPHSVTTYAKWAAATPASLLFAVKVPRTITHDQQLRRPDCRSSASSPKPPAWAASAGRCWCNCRRRSLSTGASPPVSSTCCARDTRGWRCVSLGIRGGSRQTPKSSSCVIALCVLPPIRHRHRGPTGPGGWSDIVYYRWHGSPRKYWSRYDAQR